MDDHLRGPHLRRGRAGLKNRLQNRGRGSTAEFDAQRSDLNAPVGMYIAIQLPVHPLEIGANLPERPGRHRDGCSLALVTQVHRADRLHPIGCPDPVVAKCPLQRSRHGVEKGLDSRSRLCVQDAAHALLFDPLDVGYADAQGAEHAGQGAAQHSGHAQHVRERAGMLGARPAERHQDVVANVVSLRQRDALDG